MEKRERPEICTDEMLQYLDDLRESGATNMFGAGSYVADEFDLDKKDSSAVLLYWMSSFGERHATRNARESLHRGTGRIKGERNDR